MNRKIQSLILISILTLGGCATGGFSPDASPSSPKYLKTAPFQLLGLLAASESFWELLGASGSFCELF